MSVVGLKLNHENITRSFHIQIQCTDNGGKN